MDKLNFLSRFIRRGATAIPSEALEHWIITGNIERFQKLLESETDPEKRKALESLVVAEKAKLGFKPPE